MLGYLASVRAVGLFAIAYKIPSALVSLTQSWLSAFFPHAARELAADRDAFADQIGRVLSVAIVVLLVISVGAGMCADH